MKFKLYIFANLTVYTQSVKNKTKKQAGQMKPVASLTRLDYFSDKFSLIFIF
jgi:hypothetical protein